jgi:hypothetical protein
MLHELLTSAENGMTHRLSAFLAAVLAFAVAAPSAVPAFAAPVRPAVTAPAETGLEVTTVGQRYKRRHYVYRRHHDHYRPRVYRHRHNDIGPAIGGLVAGVIIGGIIASQQPRYRTYHRTYYGNAHVDWCLNRYRSYDVRSDTFQPYHGPRRYCHSPYR